MHGSLVTMHPFNTTRDRENTMILSSGKSKKQKKCSLQSQSTIAQSSCYFLSAIHYSSSSSSCILILSVSSILTLCRMSATICSLCSLSFITFFSCDDELHLFFFKSPFQTFSLSKHPASTCTRFLSLFKLSPFILKFLPFPILPGFFFINLQLMSPSDLQIGTYQLGTC